MEQNENKIIIVDEQGRERVCEILFTYQHPETEKNYVVLYPIDELDSDEEEMDLFVASIVPVLLKHYQNYVKRKGERTKNKEKINNKQSKTS